MDANLLRAINEQFGTVSQQTETGGVVAVRNATARKQLVILAERFNAAVEDRYTEAKYPRTWPRLVRVTQGVL